MNRTLLDMVQRSAGLSSAELPAELRPVPMWPAMPLLQDFGAQDAIAAEAQPADEPSLPLELADRPRESTQAVDVATATAKTLDRTPIQTPRAAEIAQAPMSAVTSAPMRDSMSSPITTLLQRQPEVRAPSLTPPASAVGSIQGPPAALQSVIAAPLAESPSTSPPVQAAESRAMPTTASARTVAPAPRLTEPFETPIATVASDRAILTLERLGPSSRQPLPRAEGLPAVRAIDTGAVADPAPKATDIVATPERAAPQVRVEIGAIEIRTAQPTVQTPLAVPAAFVGPEGFADFSVWRSYAAWDGV